MFRVFYAITIGVIGLTAAAQASAAEAIKVGISQPISGANGDYFKRELVNPAILAIEQVNAKGGVLGHKVEYVIEDNKANAATALAVARKLIDIDHVSMISISITPAVLATLPIAEENHIVVMSAAQHPKIAQSPWGFLSTPAAPVFVDGVKTVTLRGPRIADEFKALVEDYVVRRYRRGEKAAE